MNIFWYAGLWFTIAPLHKLFWAPIMFLNFKVLRKKWHCTGRYCNNHLCADDKKTWGLCMIITLHLFCWGLGRKAGRAVGKWLLRTNVFFFIFCDLCWLEQPQWASKRYLGAGVPQPPPSSTSKHRQNSPVLKNQIYFSVLPWNLQTPAQAEIHLGTGSHGEPVRRTFLKMCPNLVRFSKCWRRYAVGRWRLGRSWWGRKIFGQVSLLSGSGAMCIHAV